jgi:hypothetical protein
MSTNSAKKDNVMIMIKEKFKKRLKEKNNKVLELAQKESDDLIIEYVDEITQQLEERILDKIEKSEKKINIRLDELNNKYNNVEEKSNVAYKRTNTLEFTGKSRELQKAVRNKAFEFSGDKGTLEYVLFHGEVRGMIYKELYDFYDVTRYGQIEEGSLLECLRRVSNFRPETNYKNKIMKNHRDKLDKGTLPPTKQKAYEQYLNKTGGIF